MKKHYKFIIGIIIGLVLSGVVGYAATIISSTNVSYNNSNSGLKSSTLQGAIDELYEKTKPCKVTSGTGKNIGDVITCGTESFYVISYSQSSTAMLAKYKLDVGYDVEYENDSYSFNLTAQRFYSSTTQLAYCSDSELRCVILNSPSNLNPVLPTDTKVTDVIDGYQKYIRNRKGLETATVSILEASQLDALGCSVSSGRESGRYTLSGKCSSTGYSWLYNTVTIITDSTAGLTAYMPPILDDDGSIILTQGPITGIRPVVTINSNQIKY